MTNGPALTPPVHPFSGATQGLALEDADAVFFAARHGTPYLNIDNEVFAETGNCLRAAIAEEGRWTDHWDFDFNGELLGPDGAFKLLDAGDLDTMSQDGPGNRQKITDFTKQIIAAGAVPIMVGGDDSVPIPFLAAFDGIGPITILQIDSHIDWREERRGEPMGFSSTMRRASEMSHVERIVQAGIRGKGSARIGEVEFARNWGAKIVTARTIHHNGIGAVLDEIPDGSQVVMTLDCDGLDPSAIPAIAAITPGGLTYTHIIELIHGVSAKAKLVGFDLIEFIPESDLGGIGAITAARIISNVIGTLANAQDAAV
ncbi:MAG: arginase family protein [Pseudomonadota bacterium]